MPLLGKEEAAGPAEAAMKTAEDQLLMRLSDEAATKTAEDQLMMRLSEEASGGSSPTSTEADTMPLLAAGDFHVGRSNSAGKQGSHVRTLNRFLKIYKTFCFHCSFFKGFSLRKYFLLRKFRSEFMFLQNS